MSDFHHYRTQLPVGEGFFHAGGAWACGSEGMDLSYVYDCGAQSYYQTEREAQIRSAMSLFWRRGSRELDLLFLSHAHVDHVNGVPQLMKHVSVGTVVMPLIEPTQRLMAFAHATHHDQIEHDVQDFFEQFTASPAAAVSSRGAGRVIEVVPGGPGDGGSAGTPSAPAPEAGSEDLPNDLPGNNAAVVELPLAENETTPRSWRLVGAGEMETVVRDDVSVLRIPDTMHFEATAAPTSFPWVLVTHVDPPVRRRASAFRAALERQLGLSPEELDEWFADPHRMRDLITNHRAELVASYLYASRRKDLNITSLSLYSGPDRARLDRKTPNATAAFSWQRGQRHYERSFRPWGEHPRVGWLGTGDAALKQDVRRTPFLAHFEPYADFIHTMTLPHHGSARSYHPELVRKLTPEFCVAPAAPYSTWQHPGPSVVASASRHALVLPVSHLPGSRLDEYIDIAVH